jgi:hypothetical protein
MRSGRMKIRRAVWILPAVAMAAACSPHPTAAGPTAAFSETAPAKTFTAAQSVPSFSLIYTPGAAQCEIVADGEVAVYPRPSVESGLFGTLPAGGREPAAAYTADGWLGFDPGVAQAANVGVFRNRWVEWGAAFHLEGSCGSLPLVIALPPGICFLMISEDTPVYESADASSAVLATLHLGDYAEAVGRQAGWFKVNLGVGSVQIDGEGWIAAALANLNGPCDGLPVLGS